MKKLMLLLGLVAVLVQPVLAFRPAGWVYFNYPWAYDNNTRDWYWFNTSDTQWIAHMGTGQWAKLQNSALASGWVYFTGNFAYAQGNSAWHWVNDADTQWVVNLRTGFWSLFGEIPGSRFAAEDFSGTWSGQGTFLASDGENHSGLVQFVLLATGGQGVAGSFSYQDITQNFTGTVDSGSLSFPLECDTPDDPDCANWDFTIVLMLQNVSTMLMDGSGIACGPGGGKQARFTGTLTRQ